MIKSEDLHLKSNLYPIYMLEESGSGYRFKKSKSDSFSYLQFDGGFLHPENGWAAKSILLLGNGFLNVVSLKHDDGRDGIWFLDSEMKLIAHKDLLSDSAYKETRYAKLWSLYLEDISRRIWLAITTPDLLKSTPHFTPSESFFSHDILQDAREVINTFIQPCQFIDLSDVNSLECISTSHYPPIQQNNLIDSILSSGTDPGSWQDKAVSTGYVEIKCPFSDQLIKSNESILLFVDGFATAYRFQSEGEVFFLIATAHANIKNVYFFPKRNILTYLQVSIYAAPVIQQQHITDFVFYLIKDWEFIKPYLLSTETKLSAASSRELHIGHHIWNELTGLDRMEKNDILKNIARYYVNEIGSEHFGSIDALFPLLKDKVRRINIFLKLPENIYRNNYFYVRPGSGFITHSLAQKVIDYSIDYTAVADIFSDNLQVFCRDDFFVVILFTLRFDNRYWINQEIGITNIVMQLSENFCGKIALIIDGHNTSGSGIKFESHGEHLLKARGMDLFNEEVQMAERIKNYISSDKITVINTIGCSVQESINWCLKCDFFVAPWGAGLAKYKWITNSPGLIFSSKEVLTGKPDLHIYDDTQYREGATLCEYLDVEEIEDIGGDGFLGGYRRNFSLPINLLYDRVEKMCKQYGRINKAANRKISRN